MKNKRIYRNKNYWIRESMKQGVKLPSERLQELKDSDSYPILLKEIPILRKMTRKELKRLALEEGFIKH